ncbi:MAG: hypothetical protein COB67_12790 [SAR324 cluster bacterium]|uniref:Uncharacterized protein n=1 Tax=SAR324 cluster bacterium TaxID=2024889 RepID=A0A2A4SQT6_9DELT|nr:MAG: hypothetical protein COB67_12790 [SAR324 cluster bacterium]
MTPASPPLFELLQQKVVTLPLGNRELESSIRDNYSLPILRELYSISLQNYLLEHTTQEFQAGILSGLGIEDLRYFEKSTIKRDVIIRVFAAILSTPKVCRPWLQGLPVKIGNILEKIVWEGVQKVTALEELFDLRIVRPSPPTGFISLPGFYLFTLQVKGNPLGVSRDDLYLGLPDSLSQQLRQSFPPAEQIELQPEPSESLPPEDLEEAGKKVQSLANIFDDVIQGNIKWGKNGQLLKRSLTRIEELTRSGLLFPIGEKIGWQCMLSLIQSCQELERKQAVEQNLQIICRQLGEAVIPLSTLLPGLQPPCSVDYGNAVKRLFEILALFSPGQWYNVDAIIRYSKRQGISLAPVGLVDSLNYESVVLRPFIEAVFFLLSGLVLLEGRNGVETVRLTTMGAFVFGKIDTLPQALRQQGQLTVHLDPDRLILTLSGEDQVKQLYLERFTRKLGRNHFKADISRLLDDVSSAGALQDKIQGFYEEISGEVPANWREFFEQVQAKVHPLERQEGLEIYQLKETDRELIRLFTSDSDLAGLIQRVENYQVAIYRKDLPKLKKKLKQLGYLF